MAAIIINKRTCLEMTQFWEGIRGSITEKYNYEKLCTFVPRISVANSETVSRLNFSHQEIAQKTQNWLLCHDTKV